MLSLNTAHRFSSRCVHTLCYSVCAQSIAGLFAGSMNCQALGNSAALISKLINLQKRNSQTNIVGSKSRAMNHLAMTGTND